MSYLAIPITAVLGALLYALEAFTFQTLWNWFVVPIFSLPHLTFIWSMGLVLVLSHIVPKAFGSLDVVKVLGSEDQHNHAVFIFFKNAFLAPVIFLTIGYLIHTFLF